MGIKMVSNLGRKIEAKNIASKSRESLDRIREARNFIGESTRSNLLSEWSERYSDDNIIRARALVRKLDDEYHNADTVHFINPKRLDRISKRMKMYMGYNPYTRKDLLRQTLDLPHTDKLSIGRDTLSDNIDYREVISGKSTALLGTTHIYSDQDEYDMDSEDVNTIMLSWNRMVKEINNE